MQDKSSSPSEEPSHVRVARACVDLLDNFNPSSDLEDYDFDKYFTAWANKYSNIVRQDVLNRNLTDQNKKNCKLFLAKMYYFKQ